MNTKVRPAGFIKCAALRMAACLLLLGGLLMAAPTAASASGPKRPPGFPDHCNEWSEYGQYLFFFACSEAGGRTIDLLTFGGEWLPVCIKDQYIATWDRGGYAGHRIDPHAADCTWKTSKPKDRQPEH